MLKLLLRGGYKNMNNKLIYIADDEINICNIMKSFLQKEGFEVITFFNGFSLLEAFTNQKSDMIIIDIMMPEMDGFTICSKIREVSSVPIIIVSAKDAESDKINGLLLGSDDYLAKPFSPLELIARMKSIFRRIEFDSSKNYPESIINICDITINPNTKHIECNNITVEFSGMEFALLYYLSKNKNRAVSRSELLDKIWGFESHVETRATDDMIKRIRKKLSDTGSKLKIDTVWGYGFKILQKD